MNNNTITPIPDDDRTSIVRVTVKQFADKIGRYHSYVSTTISKNFQKGSSTVWGFPVEKYGTMRLLKMTKAQWETLQPFELMLTGRLSREEARRRREEVILQRAAAKEARKAEMMRRYHERMAAKEAKKKKKQQVLELQERHRKKYMLEWEKFSFSPIENSWADCKEREFAAILLNHFSGISELEIPRTKHRSINYQVTIVNAEDLGLCVKLHSDTPLKQMAMLANWVIPVTLLTNFFCLWHGYLVFFEGLMPDGSPASPRLCRTKRKSPVQ